MFGIFYVTFQSICSLIGGIKNVIDDKNTKERTFDNNDNTYRDRLGGLHDVKTGYYVNLTRNNSGDKIIKNYEHKYERNIDQEKRDAEYNKLKSERPNGITVSLYHRNYENRSNVLHDALVKEIAGGSYYKDLYSDRILVKRFFTMGEGGKVIRIGTRNIKSIGCITLYMDHKTGEIIRVADGEYDRIKNDYLRKKINGRYNGNENEEIEKLKNNVEKWITDFNNNQKEEMQKYEMKKTYIQNVEKEMFFDNYFYNDCNR